MTKKREAEKASTESNREGVTAVNVNEDEDEQVNVRFGRYKVFSVNSSNLSLLIGSSLFPQPITLSLSTSVFLFNIQIFTS